MSGPRQVQRIRHKAARLAQRAGYGQRAEKRARRTDLSGSPSCSKIRHVSPDSALAHIASLVVRSGEAVVLNYYDCPDCGYIHVGHSS